MTLGEAALVDAGDLLVALDGLPGHYVHCADLAVRTLREAISHRRLQVAIGSE